MLVEPKYRYRRQLRHLQKDERALFIMFTTARRWPDHAHLIISPLRRPDGWCWCLPEIMQAIKGASARRINKLLNRKGPVWQQESFDHVLRSEESLDQKIEYLCNNPVRAGLVSSPDRYPWLWRASGDVGTGL
ncbi:MAG: hypothetical protein DMG80_09610 [Acidobacteria bacterium]|nr:MAG: hypothetical protein DMG80_09610 [Acidobacteriota bacterium]